MRLGLKDTPHGAGNGVYDVGPGRLTLRFTADPSGAAPPRVEMISYETKQHFVVDSHVLFIHAKVETNTKTQATPDARGVIATGTLSGRELDWSTPLRGFRTDGTLQCEGSGCGTSGVPPKGESPFHTGPSPVMFSNFVFDSDNLDTYRMAATKVSHTEMPRQTAKVTFAGRQTSRTCVGS
jgi:hypothetical protein